MKWPTFFNKTIKNVFCNYILHEVTTDDYKGPPYINKTIKRLMHQKKCRILILNQKQQN